MGLDQKKSLEGFVMNVLVTGCTGFLGKELITFLSMGRKYNLLCLVRPNSDYNFLKKLDVDIIEWDFSNKTTPEINRKIDVLIHLAGISPRPGQKDNQIFEENIEITKKLVNLLNDVNHIVFSSTDIVNLKNSYSESKLKCEKLIKNSSIRYTILRIGPIFGKNGKHGSASKIINFIDKKKFFPVPQDSKIKIQPIFIEDVIKFIDEVIVNKKYHNTICNVVGNPISLIEFTKVVSRILKKPNRSIKIPFFILNFLVILSGIINKKPQVTSEQLKILENNKNNFLKSDVPLTTLELSLSKFLIK
jgi:nucleoside-diphosphate-sugar epimerase